MAPLVGAGEPPAALRGGSSSRLLSPTGHINKVENGLNAAMLFGQARSGSTRACSRAVPGRAGEI